MKNMAPVTDNVFEAYANKTWRAQLAVVGISGIPSLELAGNVLRNQTTVRISLRLPPTLDAKVAGDKLKQILEKDPPYGATVKVDLITLNNGFNAPKLTEPLQKILEETSIEVYEKPLRGLGEGGSIPLMLLLQNKWPETQFIVTGILGPDNNAHGANEMLEIEYTKKYTVCMSKLISDISYIK